MSRKSFIYKSMAIATLAFLAVVIVGGWGFSRVFAPDESERAHPGAGLSPFDGARAYANLERIVAIGPRVAGTEASEKTRAIIRSALAEAGLAVREHAFDADTPIGTRSMVNLIGVVQGDRPGVIALGNHYDTKYLPQIRFVGANDGGSTTAWMIEMARALGPKRAGRTVWLCFFDGEEAFGDWSETDSRYGSRALVAMLESGGELAAMDALVNVDMIGDCYLGIFRDRAAPRWLSDAIWDTARDQGYATHFVEFGQDIEDDHLPFRRAGVPALNVIDFRFGGSSLDHALYWHTERDALNAVCAESLQTVGDVLYHSLVAIDDALDARAGR